MAAYLITGAGRGIGLEMVRQLRAGGHEVIGTVRRAEAGLELKRLGARVELLDTSDQAGVRALAEKLDGLAIDVLINNAGVYPDRRSKSMFEVTPEQILEACRVNVCGPMLVTRALAGNLERSHRKLAVQISSHMGSIARAEAENAQGCLAYRSSKTALNMVNMLMAHELAARGLTTVALHPGWVRTEMGGPNALLSVEQAVEKILATVATFTNAHNGKFMDLDGRELPW